MTEEQFYNCIVRIRNKDKSGLKDIYDAYMPYIYTILFGILQNRENAEDVASEFFIKLYTNADGYQPGNGHKGYLATIARNMAIDYIRKHKREILTADFSGSDGTENGTTSTSEDGETGYLRKQADTTESEVEEQVIGEISLQEALAKLKPEERTIIDMKILGELTFKEIAAVLAIPIGTVTWRYREGIHKLRRCGFDERS